MADLAQEQAVLSAWRAAHDAGVPPEPETVAALDALFAAAQRRVYVACRRIVRDEEMALDLAQDALLTGYRKLHTFEGQGRLSTWLYGIAKKLSLNAVRRKREVLSDDGVLDDTEPTAGVLKRMRKEEREAVFREVAAELDPLEQEAIYLRYVEEVPQSAITEILGLTDKSGARGLLQRCRRRLQRGLRAKLEELGHGSSFFRVTT